MKYWSLTFLSLFLFLACNKTGTGISSYEEEDAVSTGEAAESYNTEPEEVYVANSGLDGVVCTIDGICLEAFSEEECLDVEGTPASAASCASLSPVAQCTSADGVALYVVDEDVEEFCDYADEIYVYGQSNTEEEDSEYDSYDEYEYDDSYEDDYTTDDEYDYVPEESTDSVEAVDTSIDSYDPVSCYIEAMGFCSDSYPEVLCEASEGEVVTECDSDSALNTCEDALGATYYVYTVSAEELYCN
jgi:hypothetical protein